jgi:glycine/D-amino acid oxidase-like deaminating enzyme
MNSPDLLIIGGGIMGITAALELRRRDYKVAVLDRGPLPHPQATSSDISKVVRLEYGPDELYMAMVELALPGWRRWNEELGEKLFHEVGVLMLTRRPMAPGGFEYESYQMLRRRGHQPERLTGPEISRRFPAWSPGAYADGFYHAQGGFVESGRLVQALVAHAARLGVVFYPDRPVKELLSDNGRVTAVRLEDGATMSAGHIVVSAGAWSPLLVPELAPVMPAVGQPVFHLKAAQPDLFTTPKFTVFTADIAETGWYGFPLHPRAGVIKIANHGVGQRLHSANDIPQVTAVAEQELRRFLAAALPSLAQAPIVYRRCCLYCDTLDGHLWIDRHPQQAGLTVAAGGSGHAFKFGPLLGQLIADAVEGRPNQWLPRFRWRQLAADTAGEEAARHHAPK